jgi:hypothetical protein
MHLGKFLALAATAVLALLSTAEAKHKRRSRGWRKLVHHRCGQNGEVALAVGGRINKDMILTVKRALRHGVNDMTVFINGRDLSKPRNRKNRKRNVQFVKDIADKVSIAVLPWTTSRKLTSLKNRKLGRVYSKSASAIEKVIGAKPLVVHVEKKFLTRKIVKFLHGKGHIVVGQTTRFEDPKTVLKQKSFIALNHPTAHSFRKVVHSVDKAFLTAVSLSKCIGKPIYEGGAEDNEEASDEDDEDNESGDDE